MENEQKIIRKFQDVINLEFNKKFEITMNNRNYTIAFPLDEVPVVKSLNKDGSIVIFMFSDFDQKYSIDENKIFSFLEKEPGKFQAVIVNLNNRNKEKKFEIGREVIDEINDYELIGNDIVNTKRKYLVHALYDALTSKVENFWNVDHHLPNSENAACISIK